MSGDVQPRKRKDKKRRKDEGEPIFTQSAHTPVSANPPSEDVNIHVHKEDGTGGGICAKLVFFVLLSALVVVIGMIITEYRGLSDVDTVDSESKFAQIFEGWIDTGHRHDDHEIEEAIDDHDHEDEEENASEDEHESHEPSEEEEDDEKEPSEEDEDEEQEEEDEGPAVDDSEEEQPEESDENALDDEEDENDDASPEKATYESEEKDEEEEDDDDDDQDEEDEPEPEEDEPDHDEDEQELQNIASEEDNDDDADASTEQASKEDEDDEDTLKEDDSDESDEKTSAIPEKIVQKRDVEEDAQPEEGRQESGGMAVKLGVGVAILVVAHLVLVRKWRSPAPAEKPLDEDITKEPTPDLSRRNTIVAPPTLQEVEPDIEQDEEDYSEEEEVSEDEEHPEPKSAKTRYQELRSTYTRSLTPEGEIDYHKEPETYEEEYEEEEEELSEEEEEEDEEEDEDYDEDEDEELLKRLEAKYGKIQGDKIAGCEKEKCVFNKLLVKTNGFLV